MKVTGLKTRLTEKASTPMEMEQCTQGTGSSISSMDKEKNAGQMVPTITDSL
jgi:hypothetical protein